MQNSEDQTYVKTELGAFEIYRKVLGTTLDANNDYFLIKFDR